ncbi:MAG TPA: hypothetical protein EYP98_07190 [Planctomycetes bacterium]|nr:hypothetical protein [Planctomycetota bacterium]
MQSALRSDGCLDHLARAHLIGWQRAADEQSVVVGDRLGHAHQGALQTKLACCRFAELLHHRIHQIKVFPIAGYQHGVRRFVVLEHGLAATAPLIGQRIDKALLPKQFPAVRSYQACQPSDRADIPCHIGARLIHGIRDVSQFDHGSPLRASPSPQVQTG